MKLKGSETNKNIMNKTKNENNITTLDEILDKKYGKRGVKKKGAVGAGI